MDTQKPRETVGEIGEYFDVKEQRGAIAMDDVGRDSEDVESLPSRTSSSNFILEGCSRLRSHKFTVPLSPLHFKHLNSPNPHAYCMPSPLNSHNFDKPRGSRRRSCLTTLCCCCCSLCSVLVTASILVGIVALILWLILRPVHAPRYSLDNVEFRNLTVTGRDYITNADVVFSITAENPNKRLGFKYDGVGIETSYRGNILGRSDVASFTVSHRNVTTVTSELVVKDFVFAPASLGQDLSVDVKLARVELRVRATAKVRVTLGVFTSFAVKVFVHCDVAVKPPLGKSPSSVIEKTCKLTR